MDKIRKFVRNVLTENTTGELTLYHGSSNDTVFSHFYDNQFFTVNDYIACNYAYNNGGLMYEVKIQSLHPFKLEDYSPKNNPKEFDAMIKLLGQLYGENAVNYYTNSFFFPSPSNAFDPIGWGPFIKWAKENGYDSLQFFDESFDRFVRDTTYLVFDGGKAKITNVFDVTDAVESNFAKPLLPIDASNS